MSLHGMALLSFILMAAHVEGLETRWRHKHALSFRVCLKIRARKLCSLTLPNPPKILNKRIYPKSWYHNSPKAPGVGNFTRLCRPHSTQPYRNCSNTRVVILVETSSCGHRCQESIQNVPHMQKQSSKHFSETSVKTRESVLTRSLFNTNTAPYPKSPTSQSEGISPKDHEHDRFQYGSPTFLQTRARRTLTHRSWTIPFKYVCVCGSLPQVLLWAVAGDLYPK